MRFYTHTFLNAEGHDESQYLPKVFNKATGKMENMPVVNAYRERQGGVRYEGEAIKALQWMPDIIFDRENEKERPYNDTCVSFYTYHVQANQSLGISDIKNILFDKAQDVSSLPPIDTYSAILRGLVKPESNMLLWVVCNERNKGNVALARHLIGTIRHAIENAQIIIDNLAKNRKIEKSSAPELRLNYDPFINS